MRSALFLARADLVHLLRQREVLMWTFLMPALFFYFIGTVTGGSGFGPVAKDAPLTLVVPYAAPTEPNEDVVVEELVRRLEAESFVVTRVASATDPDAGKPRLELPAPPEGFPHWTAALAAEHELDATLHKAKGGSQGDLDLLLVGKASYGLLLDLAVFELEGSAPVPASFAELRERPRALTVDTKSAGRRPDPPQGYAQTIPGTMVMFTMLILLTGGSILIVTERRDGLLRRLASAPISRGSVLFGKWLARMGLAVVQLTFSMLLGSLMFGMDWGEQLPMVCLLLFVWAAFNASLALFLANLVSTEGQMSGIAVLSSMVLAALGGCWWPIEVTPGWMQSLAGFLPTGWAMDAMHALVHFGHGPAEVIGDLSLIAGGALVFGFFGARSFRYE